jgi:cytochrome P460
VLRALGVLALAALIVGAVASAQSRKDGLPTFVDGYAAWPKLNRKPIVGGSSAHQGTKNVYASRRRAENRFSVGTIIVKTASPTGKRWLSLVATMRRVKGTQNGGWLWAEYTRSAPGTRFTKVAFPASGCAACHAQAKTNDFVFTRR